MIAENKNGKLIIERTNNGLFILVEDKNGKSVIEMPVETFLNTVEKCIKSNEIYKLIMSTYHTNNSKINVIEPIKIRSENYMNRYKIILKDGSENFIETKVSLTNIMKDIKDAGFFISPNVVVREEYLAAIIKVKERELTEDEIEDILRGN